MQKRQNIIELLRDSSLVSGEKCFLTDGDRSFTYHEFWLKVERLAAYFAQNAKPQSQLLIAAENDYRYILAYFAALAARQVTVEVRPSESHETMREIVADASPWAIYTDVPGLAGQLGLQSVDVEAQSNGPNNSPGKWLQSDNSQASDIASVVYTSGTTGRPKGVMLTHGNFLSVTESILDRVRISATDRYVLALPLFHTYGKSVLHTATQVGATLRLANDFTNLPKFLRMLAEDKITVFSGVPFHIRALLRWGRLKEFDLRHLRMVTVSGAALHPDHMKALKVALPGIEFYYMYGLTETCTRACILPSADFDRKCGSVGPPIKSVRVAIRDEAGNELPPYREGDIWLSGPNVMVGYFKAPELTGQTLRDGWLWTGDVGFVDEEGYLSITSRRKDIIKCAGERIAPKEIELVLETHPNVVEAAVVGAPDPLLGESVCAYIIEKEPRRDQQDLHGWCVKRLSHHKLPRRYLFVSDFPRTPSGKIQKQLLLNSCAYS